eukprot:15276662-Ditylum_brightwellii.AAC.1
MSFILQPNHGQDVGDDEAIINHNNNIFRVCCHTSDNEDIDCSNFDNWINEYTAEEHTSYLKREASFRNNSMNKTVT